MKIFIIIALLLRQSIQSLAGCPNGDASYTGTNSGLMPQARNLCVQDSTCCFYVTLTGLSALNTPSTATGIQYKCQPIDYNSATSSYSTDKSYINQQRISFCSKKVLSVNTVSTTYISECQCGLDSFSKNIYVNFTLILLILIICIQ